MSKSKGKEVTFIMLVELAIRYGFTPAANMHTTADKLVQGINNGTLQLGERGAKFNAANSTDRGGDIHIFDSPKGVWWKKYMAKVNPVLAVGSKENPKGIGLANESATYMKIRQTRKYAFENADFLMRELAIGAGQLKRRKPSKPKAKKQQPATQPAAQPATQPAAQPATS